MKSNSLKLISITILASVSSLISFAQPGQAFWGNKTQTIKLGRTSVSDVDGYCRATGKCGANLTASTTQVNPDRLCKWKYGNDYEKKDIYGRRAGGGFGPIQFNNSIDCFAKNQPIDE
ncbi:MAG: hypothetical protein HC860_13640 [Alkalinema sp. RU_4_3]|nr:hypothetical protein [Alkalinema sp. RU_4_3]